MNASTSQSKEKGEFIPPKNWTEISNGVYDVEGDVIGYNIPNLIDPSGKLRVKFRKVSGSCSLTACGMTTLEGCPKIVGGNFYCGWNGLENLQGGPTYVGGDYECHTNNLVSLVGAPTKILGDFTCANNYLTSLDGAPKEVKGRFICASNKLKTLIGGPELVGGTYCCDYNQLENLKGAPYEVGRDFTCSHNNLKSLRDCTFSVKGDIVCSYNNISDLEYTRESDNVLNYGIGENPGITHLPGKEGGYVIEAKVLPGCAYMIKNGKLHDEPISIDWKGFTRPLEQYTRWIPRNKRVNHLNMTQEQWRDFTNLRDHKNIKFLEEDTLERAEIEKNLPPEIDF